MKEYKVTIEETVSKDVRVSAENENEAITTVIDLYENGDIVLDPSELIDVKFGCTEEQPKKQILIEGTAEVKDATVKITNQTLLNNLILIDSTLPQILEYMLGHTPIGSTESIKDLTERCSRDNICKITMKQDVIVYYRKKVTDFLYAILHGMDCDKAWDGRCNSKGIYIFEGCIFGGYDRGRMMEYLWETGCIEVKSEKNIETGSEIEWNIHL